MRGSKAKLIRRQLKGMLHPQMPDVAYETIEHPPKMRWNPLTQKMEQYVPTQRVLATCFRKYYQETKAIFKSASRGALSPAAFM